MLYDSIPPGFMIPCNVSYSATCSFLNSTHFRLKCNAQFSSRLLVPNQVRWNDLRIVDEREFESSPPSNEEDPEEGVVVVLSRMMTLILPQSLRRRSGYFLNVNKGV